MNDEHDHELVMPFVVVESVGGPFEDQAYVAGYEAGLLDQLLSLGGKTVAQTVRTDNVPQLDLIAMRHGMALEAEEAGDGWSFITVSPMKATL